MYKLVNTNTGEDIGVVDEVTYMKKNDNYDVYSPTTEAKAIAIAYKGVLYNLVGYSEIPDADTAVIVKVSTEDEFIKTSVLATSYDEGVNSI